jgi:hypothetical protein
MTTFQPRFVAYLSSPSSAIGSHRSENAGWIGAGNLGEREWTIEVPEV